MPRGVVLNGKGVVQKCDICGKSINQTPVEDIRLAAAGFDNVMHLRCRIGAENFRNGVNDALLDAGKEISETFLEPPDA